MSYRGGSADDDGYVLRAGVKGYIKLQAAGLGAQAPREALSRATHAARRGRRHGEEGDVTGDAPGALGTPSPGSAVAEAGRIVVGGMASVLQRRETLADLTARDAKRG